ncbi:MAG: PhoU domain-containing protein [Promethearchaeota archaeon]
MYRKIQLTGNKTYSINIPKSWVENNSLKKGSEVILKEMDDGTLLITAPRLAKEPRPKKIVIVASESLARDITRAYLLGYEQIIIRTSRAQGFSREELDEIEEKRNQYPGAEIFSESKNEIMLEIIASFEKNHPYKLIHRLFNLTQDMLERICTVLNPKKSLEHISSEEELNRIINIDNKINRTYFLIVRQLRALTSEAKLRNALNISTLELMDYRLISHLLENIGDNCVYICKHLLEFKPKILPLLEKKYNPDEKKDIIFDTLITMAETVKMYHNETFDAFRTNDSKKAAKIIQESSAFSQMDRPRFIEDFKREPNKVELSIIAYRFSDIYDMLMDICDFIQPSI